jgi:hypothetical protein
MSDKEKVVGTMVGGSVKRFDVGGNRQLTMLEIATETGLSKESIRKRLAKGMVGAELLEPATTKTKDVKRPTPISGWTDEQLYWLRLGYGPSGGPIDGGRKPKFEDDGREISWRPPATFFDAVTGKDIA